jgi:probable rRNA maturation factor
MRINIVNYFDDKEYDAVINHVLSTALNYLQLQKKEINIILVDNKQIQDLNKQYRDKDYPTDVLTFPDGNYNNLGDIFVSLEKCEEQRIEYGHSFDRELGFLVVHGLLHTLGYDHQSKEQEEEMISIQEKILRKAKLYR